MPAELRSATHDDRHRHYHNSIFIHEDGPPYRSRPPFPIMPTSHPASSQPDGQQQQQQRHSLSSGRVNAEGRSSDVISPDPRLAMAASAAAAESAANATAASSSSSSSSNAVLSYQRLVKRYRVEVAASASSVLSTLTTFPLDSVKTRMQTYRYAGFLDCVRHTYQTERLRGFFRGRAATMLSSKMRHRLTTFCLLLSRFQE